MKLLVYQPCQRKLNPVEVLGQEVHVLYSVVNVAALVEAPKVLLSKSEQILATGRIDVAILLHIEDNEGQVLDHFSFNVLQSS